jgi:phosphatidylglycerol lysyltransferase
MLLMLLPCRTSFYRKSSILAGRLTSGWVILAVAAVLCSVWLGIFAYKYEEYSQNLWWLFATDADAPRFLRGSAGAVSIILLFAIARLIRGSAYPQQATLADCEEDIGKIVAASPKTCAHLALLGDKQFVFNDERNSFIMFAIEGRSWVTMGDPVGLEDEWDDLLWSFREMCDEHDAWPVFYQIDQANLPLYLQFGKRPKWTLGHSRSKAANTKGCATPTTSSPKKDAPSKSSRRRALTQLCRRSGIFQTAGLSQNTPEKKDSRWAVSSRNISG